MIATSTTPENHERADPYRAASSIRGNEADRRASWNYTIRKAEFPGLLNRLPTFTTKMALHEVAPIAQSHSIRSGSQESR